MITSEKLVPSSVMPLVNGVQATGCDRFSVVSCASASRKVANRPDQKALPGSASMNGNKAENT